MVSSRAPHLAGTTMGICRLHGLPDPWLGVSTHDSQGLSSSLPGCHIVNRTHTSATNSLPRAGLPVLNLQDVLYIALSSHGLGSKIPICNFGGRPGGGGARGCC